MSTWADRRGRPEGAGRVGGAWGLRRKLPDDLGPMRRLLVRSSAACESEWKTGLSAELLPRLRRGLAVLMLLFIVGLLGRGVPAAARLGGAGAAGLPGGVRQHAGAGMAIMVPGVNVVVFVAGALGSTPGGAARRLRLRPGRVDRLCRWPSDAQPGDRAAAGLPLGQGACHAGPAERVPHHPWPGLRLGGAGDVAGLVAGRVGYSYRKFFLATFLGKTLRFLLVALLGGRLLPPA